MKKIWGIINNYLIKVKNYQSLKNNQIRSLSFFLSLFLTALEFYKFNVIWSSKEFILSSIAMTFSIFIMVYPCLYFFRIKFKDFFTNHIFFSMSMLLYFTVLIPVLGEINDSFLAASLNEIIIKILHIITIFVSMILILLIVSRQFIMLIYKKRKIEGIDIFTTFLTYIILGVSFGSFYYIANLMAVENLFIGVVKPSLFNFETYLNHVYISLGNLTTLGTGTISPINPYIRIISVLESVLGIFLTSFSLGFIFSVLGSNQSLEIVKSEDDKSLEVEKKLSFIGYIKKSLNELITDLREIEKK